MAGISKKEMEFVSKLELKGNYFFKRNDIRKHFTSDNEMNVYLHRMKQKGRIVKLNKDKYYLLPVRAVGNRWSEHPFILIDEIMNSRDYCIAGKAAAYYWKLTDQIPYEYEVYNTKKQKTIRIFHTRIKFVKRRKINLPKTFEGSMQGHRFLIATGKESKKWI